MRVTELIKRLQEMPPDAEVWSLWDGGLGSEINCVWLARSGVVATSDYDAVCYDTEDRPADAPTNAVEPYWHTSNAGDEP